MPQTVLQMKTGTAVYHNIQDYWCLYKIILYVNLLAVGFLTRSQVYVSLLVCGGWEGCPLYQWGPVPGPRSRLGSFSVVWDLSDEGSGGSEHNVLWPSVSDFDGYGSSTASYVGIECISVLLGAYAWVFGRSGLLGHVGGFVKGIVGSYGRSYG